MALAMLLYWRSSTLQKDQNSLPSQRTKRLADAGDKAMLMLGSEDEYVPSITEQTTELLELSKREDTEMKRGKEADA
jgi:hypothetical protein